MSLLSNNGSPLGDHQWVRNAMFIPKGYSVRATQKRRLYSRASEKFYDTSLGGNLSLNPLPQFTPTADLRVGTLASSTGMGEVYSEYFDDMQYRVSFQFGVPEFNSIASFASNMYNPMLASLVNRGETSRWMYRIGYTVGFMFTLPLQAFFGLHAIGTRAISFISGNPYSKFCYLKPTMPLYVNAATVIYNELLVNMGITQANITGQDTLSKSEVDLLNATLPDIIKSKDDGSALNGVSLYAVTTRAQRLADEHNRKMEAITKNSKTPAELSAAVKKEIERPKADLRAKYSDHAEYVNSYLNGIHAKQKLKPITFPEDGAAAGTGPSDTETPEKPTGNDSVGAYVRAKGASFMESMMAELHDGSSFVSFRVDSNSPTESFNNNFEISGLQEKLNGVSGAARDIRYSLAEGNIVGGVQQAMVQGVKDVIVGALDSVGLSGLAGLAGDAYVDVPKLWKDSTAEMARMNFTIRLCSPYGCKEAIALHLYPTLSYLLAGALPRSTGKHTYSAPFHCRIFSQGVCDIKYGAIDSLTISRGGGGIGWTADGLNHVIDVNIGIVNLDTVMHMPIMDRLGPGGIFSAFDEDSMFTDYMSTLSALPLSSSYYFIPRFKLAWGKTVQNWESYTSKEHIASWAGGTLPGRVISLFARDGELK